jgi:inner membrane protein
MDNVTHSLAGLLLAESMARLRARHANPERPVGLCAVAAVSSMLAANLPDADLFYSGLGGDRLRYMLHHRGYTHTVVIAILGAVLVWAVAAFVWRCRGRESARQGDSRWLLALLLGATLSHLALDWTNSYGVHPFWPVDDRWRYGDAVFIVEPWLWVVSVPALVAASTSRVARVLLSLVLLAGLTLAWRVDLVSTGAAVVLTAGAALSVGLARVLRAHARALVAIAGWIAVTVTLAAGTARARATVVREVRGLDPAAELLDVVVSPLPANAACMSVITVERSGPTYRVATARVSSVPSVVAAARCGQRATAGGSLGSSARRSTAAVQWGGEWASPSQDLEALVRESCIALAAMRFIRVPVWTPLDDSTVLLGDVRYGGGGGGFADVRVPRRSAACPRAVPPWTPPRTDLLSGGASSPDN